MHIIRAGSLRNSFGTYKGFPSVYICKCFEFSHEKITKLNICDLVLIFCMIILSYYSLCQLYIDIESN